METKRYITIDEFFNDFDDKNIYNLNYQNYYFLTFVNYDKYNRIFVIYKIDNSNIRYCLTEIGRTENSEEDFLNTNSYQLLEETFDDLNKQIGEIIKKDNERNENE